MQLEKRKRDATGFTLMELMVVVAIVGVLAVGGLTMAKMVRAKADEATCMNNLRQIGVALQIYASDHGRYPETTHSASLGRAWIYELESYLGDFDRTRICPADPNGGKRLDWQGTSYLLNSFIFVPKADPFGNPIGQAMNRPTSLEDPSRTILAFCCSDHVPAGPGNDHTHSERWTSWAALTRDIAPDRHGGRSSNYLFADGRVESWLEVEVRRKIESGVNIAKPPGYEP